MVSFIGFLKDTGHAIKINSEGEGEITFTIPQSDLTRALPLAGMGGKLLEIVVSEAEGEIKKNAINQWLNKSK